MTDRLGRTSTAGEAANYMPSPDEFTLAVRIGKVMAESGFFKDSRDTAQAIAKVLAGRELGIGPFSAMNGIHLIQGKPQVGANLIAGAVKRHPDYDYLVREKTDDRCAIEFFQRGKSIGIETWTIAMADRAGLTKRNPVWTSYPQAMLFSRCISSGYKAYCPDVFSTAVYVDGELDDEMEPSPRYVQAEVIDDCGPRDTTIIRDDPRRARTDLPRPLPEDLLGPSYVLQANDFAARDEDAGLTAGEAHSWQGRAVARAKRAAEEGDPLQGRQRALAKLALTLQRERHGADLERIAKATKGDRDDLHHLCHQGKLRLSADEKALDHDGLLSSLSRARIKSLLAALDKPTVETDPDDEARRGRILAELEAIEAEAHNEAVLGWGRRGGLELSDPGDATVADVIAGLSPSEALAVEQGMADWLEAQHGE